MLPVRSLSNQTAFYHPTKIRFAGTRYPLEYCHYERNHCVC
ncbi:hypothetical protein l11_22210 [Neisseria weaveri LMG 5135]|nr:hypothetical protein l11_22210 [Neisseria weaveri LMG 5135]